jgi:hypothetical protein
MTGAGKPRLEVGLLHLAVVVSVTLPAEHKNSLLSAADVVKEGATLPNPLDYAYTQKMAMI